MMCSATGAKHKDQWGIVAATGCNTVYTSTYPYNPYLVPWTNSLFRSNPMSTTTHEPLVLSNDTSEQTGSMQLVSFKLGNETYGLAREVRDCCNQVVTTRRQNVRQLFCLALFEHKSLRQER